MVSEIASSLHQLHQPDHPPGDGPVLFGDVLPGVVGEIEEVTSARTAFEGLRELAAGGTLVSDEAVTAARERFVHALAVTHGSTGVDQIR